MSRIKPLSASAVQNAGIKPKIMDSYPVFTMEKGRDFKILQLTDLHFGRNIFSYKRDILARNAIIELVERVKPDLIISTGDNAYPVPWFGSRNNLKQAKYVGELFESFQIPWTTVFGNHDTEPFSTHTREEICSYYSGLKGCLMRNAEGVSGTGNHAIVVNNYDGGINKVLVMLDSNTYLGKTFFSTFDNIHDDQIEWYKDTVKKISGENALAESLAFFHMPLAEYRDAWHKLKTGHIGEVTYHCGTINEINDHIGFSRRKEGRFFEKMHAFGSLKGCFCGHDHLNNISMTYKGIRLTYGMAIDFLAYPKIMKKYTNRGGTVITLSDDGAFDVRLEPLTSAVEIYV